MPDLASPTVPVTAVLVSRDGARWLPEVLAALAAQTVRPARVVAVDTGSRDGSEQLLQAALGSVLVLPGASYAVAVGTALDAVPVTHWLWLLHDDAAPDPDALAQLLAADPATAVRGPKAVDWDDPRVLVEVGLTTDTAGRRVTGLEPDEQDQGQHDAPRDVLAVGTAGALVRREVWDAVGGLDPALPLFHADVDLGRRVVAAGHRVHVVPAARLRHARAASTGRRRLRERPRAVDSRARAYVRLAHAPALLLAPTAVRIVLGALLRSLALLLGRRPRAAADELASVTVLGRPGPLRRARRDRRGARPPRVLLPPRSARLRGVAAGAFEKAAAAGGSRWRPGPAALLAVGLGAVALLAERSLLRGGALNGGRLVPAPDSGIGLLRAYVDGAPAADAVLGLAGLLLLDRPALVVDLLVLAGVPAAGAVAWWAAGRVVRLPVLRLWAAATWALLPVATGAVAAGRLDALAVQVALPAALVVGHAVVTGDPRGRWQRAWALGLALTAVAALAPVAWLLAAALLLGLAATRVVGAAERPAAVRGLLAALVVLVVPLLVLLPWPPDAGALLHGPGRLAPGLAQADLSAWRLPLLWPGGPGLPAVAVTGGLLLAALAALLRSDRARLVLAGWAVALTGLLGAVVLARLVLDGSAVWPGVALQVTAAGLLLAALAGAEGLPELLGRNAFGARQLAVVAVVAAAAAVPALCASTWVARGADGPLQRDGAAPLPAYVLADLDAGAARAIVIEPGDETAYAVAGLDRQDAAPDLAAAVADLLSPRGAPAAELLAARAVRWVVLTGGSGPDAATLDAQPGLLRQPGAAPLVWRVSAPARLEQPDDRRPVLLPALLLLGVAVLAGPGGPRYRGLERVR